MFRGNGQRTKAPPREVSPGRVGGGPPSSSPGFKNEKFKNIKIQKFKILNFFKQATGSLAGSSLHNLPFCVPQTQRPQINQMQCARRGVVGSCSFGGAMAWRGTSRGTPTIRCRTTPSWSTRATPPHVASPTPGGAFFQNLFSKLGFFHGIKEG